MNLSGNTSVVLPQISFLLFFEKNHRDRQSEAVLIGIITITTIKDDYLPLHLNEKKIRNRKIY